MLYFIVRKYFRCHVVQNSPLSHVTPNVIMNANLMEACYVNKVKKFIFMSSSVVYSYTAEKPNKEDEFTFGDIYKSYYAVGWMKRYTEHLCEMYSTFFESNYAMYSSQTS